MRPVQSQFPPYKFTSKKSSWQWLPAASGACNVAGTWKTSIESYTVGCVVLYSGSSGSASRRFFLFAVALVVFEQLVESDDGAVPVVVRQDAVLQLLVDGEDAVVETPPREEL
ncbi:hypothetical protein PG995_011544 [Apiospora arundinis]